MRRFHKRPQDRLIWVFELTVMVFTVGFVLAAPALPARAAQNHLITMTDYAFTPQFLTIATGDTVQWVNNGAAAHTATSNTSAWTNVILSPTQTSAMIPINAPGTYDYYCLYHISFDMWGSITATGSVVPEFSSSAVVVVGLLVMAIGLIVASKTRR